MALFAAAFPFLVANSRVGFLLVRRCSRLFDAAVATHSVQWYTTIHEAGRGTRGITSTADTEGGTHDGSGSASIYLGRVSRSRAQSGSQERVCQRLDVRHGWGEPAAQPYCRQCV